MEIKLKRKPPNFWRNWRNLQNEIEGIIINGHFPTLEFVRNKLGNGAVKAINHFGGVRTVSQLMGYKLHSYLVTSDGHHVQSSYEFLFDEFLFHHKIPHEVGGLISPNHKFRYDFKIGSHYVEIWGYPITNGQRQQAYAKRRKLKEELYKELNFELISVVPQDLTENCLKTISSQFNVNYDEAFPISNFIHHTSYWNYENTLAELKKLCSEILPSWSEIQKIPGLSHGLHQHGGLSHFSRVLGKPMLRAENWTKEAIVEKLKEIVNKIGHFPTCGELKKDGYTGLLTAVEEKGGVNKFRAILGFSSIKRQNNYWNEEKILTEMRMLFKKIGRKPKTVDLMKTPIHSAIHKTGNGLKYFIERL